MSSMVNWFFRQKVAESELDLAFELLEKADRDLAADVGIYGIISGAIPVPHEPVPDLSIDLTGPTRAYDHLGQRIFVGTGLTVDCSADHTGIPTEVPVADHERWVGVFLTFDRLLSDPRTDGNSQQVYFRRDESYQVIVRQGAAAPIGFASRVALVDDELLVCDVLRRHGQTQILAADIDTSRRQAFRFATAEAVGVDPDTWTAIAPEQETVQASLDAVDGLLTGHHAGTSNRHPALHIDTEPRAFVTDTNLQDALHHLIDALTTAMSGTPGASRIGADSVAGTPHALPASTVDTQLSQLLGWLNAHVGAATGAHHASAIVATPHHHLASTSVQAQFQELLDRLVSQADPSGAESIGGRTVGTGRFSLSAGDLHRQLGSVLGIIEEHASSGDHDARYYAEGSTVVNSSKLGGKAPAEYAAAGHDHDDEYLRVVYADSRLYQPGALVTLTSLAMLPWHVGVSYSYAAQDGSQELSYYFAGSRTPELQVIVSKNTTTDLFDLIAKNNSSYALYLNVTVYDRNMPPV